MIRTWSTTTGTTVPHVLVVQLYYLYVRVLLRVLVVHVLPDNKDSTGRHVGRSTGIRIRVPYLGTKLVRLYMYRRSTGTGTAVPVPVSY